MSFLLMNEQQARDAFEDVRTKRVLQMGKIKEAYTAWRESTKPGEHTARAWRDYCTTVDEMKRLDEEAKKVAEILVRMW